MFGVRQIVDTFFLFQDFLKDSLPNKTTLDAKDGYSQMAMGQKAILSFFDAKTVNFAYCSGKMHSFIDMARTS